MRRGCNVWKCKWTTEAYDAGQVWDRKSLIQADARCRAPAAATLKHIKYGVVVVLCKGLQNLSCENILSRDYKMCLQII